MLGARLTEATSTDPSVSGATLIKATHALRTALTPARTDLGSSTPFTDADPHKGKSFDFLADPREDLYSLEDGDPV